MMEPFRGDGVRGLTVAVVRVAVEIIPNDGDFGSWFMPTKGQKGREWEYFNIQHCIQMKEFCSGQKVLWAVRSISHDYILKS